MERRRSRRSTFFIRRYSISCVISYFGRGAAWPWTPLLPFPRHRVLPCDFRAVKTKDIQISEAKTLVSSV